MFAPPPVALNPPELGPLEPSAISRFLTSVAILTNADSTFKSCFADVSKKWMLYSLARFWPSSKEIACKQTKHTKQRRSVNTNRSTSNEQQQNTNVPFGQAEHRTCFRSKSCSHSRQHAVTTSVVSMRNGDKIKQKMSETPTIWIWATQLRIEVNELRSVTS